MKSKSLYFLLLFGVISATTLGLWLHASPQTNVQKTTETKLLPPDLYRKLTTPSSRDILLQSIRSLPQPIKLPSLQKKQVLTGRQVTRTTETALKPAPEPEQIDWKAGVYISPFSIPEYGYHKPLAWVHVGLTPVNMAYHSIYPLMCFMYPPDCQGCCTHVASYELQMPGTQAYYAIEVKLISAGTTHNPASWVIASSPVLPTCNIPRQNLYAPIIVYFEGVNVPLTQLIDGSGYVGIGYNYYKFETHGLVPIQIYVLPYASSSEERMSGIRFGGIVLTQLQ